MLQFIYLFVRISVVLFVASLAFYGAAELAMDHLPQPLPF